MNLKELKQMIAEEYTAYQRRIKEQNMDMDPMGGPNMPKIDVGPDDIDIDSKESPEETLRAIFDMLKDFFEGDDKPASPAPKPAPKADKKDDDKKDDDKKDDKKDDDEMKEGMGMYDEDEKEEKKENLQERFQKLANIIK
tara:strand:- start:64 stop:483 length:420 start_codon:yes stop_codon:yes gene_type:complete